MSAAASADADDDGDGDGTIGPDGPDADEGLCVA
jgi:hypothetical protein